MMYEQIVTLVSTVVFPIAMCILMCLYINKRDEEHKKETQGYIESIHEVKLVLEQLKTILERRGQ